MRVIAWFELAVGVAIAVLWLLLLASGQVPEIAAGQGAIWFHLAAELLTAGLLVVDGLALLCRRPAAGCWLLSRWARCCAGRSTAPATMLTSATGRSWACSSRWRP